MQSDPEGGVSHSRRGHVGAWLAAIAAFTATSSNAAAGPTTPSVLSGRFLTAVGRISAGGLTGEWREVVDLAVGRFATLADLGVYRTADVYDGQMRWRVDPSGANHPLNSEAARQGAVTEAWLARFIGTGQNLRGFPHAPPKAEIVEGRRYRTVKVTPEGGKPVTLWFEASDGKLVRATRWLWFFDYTTTYGDYREVDGKSLPFAIGNSGAGLVENIKLTGFSYSAKAPRNSFVRPPQPADAVVPASGTLVSATVFPQLTLQASVNGHPMDFLFDTGGHSVLTPEAAKSLGLTAFGSRQSGGSGAGTLLQQDTRVDEVQIGEAVLRNQHFAVLSLPYSDVEQGPKPPLAGLLGLEVAERFVVRLDYRTGTLSLFPPTAKPACRSGWRPIQFTYDMPAVHALLDGRSASFTIDTGNNGGLLLYRYWMQAHGLGAHYDHGAQTLSYGAGGASNNWISYGESFSIGKAVVPRPMLRTTDDKGGVALSHSEAGNLGTNLLANYTITFDYGRSRGCFDYVPGYHPMPFNRAGLRAIKEDPGSFLVTLVNAGGPADQAGLRKDDRIVAVDGVSADRLGEADLTLALTRAPGSSISLQYQRAGQAHGTVLTTREMLQ